VGRLASSFLQYAAEFGEEERVKAESAIVSQLVNIQSGYPAFFKFSDSDKAVTIQSPCDGLAKAIQQYRKQHGGATDPNFEQLTFMSKLTETVAVHVGEEPKAPQGGRALPSCGKCGAEAFVKIDGCLVCQGCGFSKCG
jgi:hypothetical protein